MIVECQECATRFQLDESRVPTEGIRVRCSRCKHSFFLQPPGANEEDATHAVAEQAARGATPGTTQDLSFSSELRSDASSSSDDEESDWEFNDEVPAADASAPGIVSEASDRFEAAVESEAVSEIEEPAEPEGFGSIDDYDSLADEEAPSALAESATDELVQDAAESILDAIGDDSELRTRQEDLGDPESWDFFAEEEGPPSPTAFDALDSPRPAPERSVSPAAAVRVDAAIDGFASSAPVADLDEDEGSGRLGALLRGGLSLGGWVLTLALIGLGISRAWLPGAGVTASDPVAHAGPLRAEALELSWVDTARLGPLFVVRGELENGGGEALRASDWRVALLAADGSPLEIVAPLGLPLPEPELRGSTPSSLSASVAAAREALDRAAIEPGARLRFEAIFEAVPVEADRFEMRAGRGVELPPLVRFEDTSQAESLAEPAR